MTCGIQADDLVLHGFEGVTSKQQAFPFPNKYPMEIGICEVTHVSLACFWTWLLLEIKHALCNPVSYVGIFYECLHVHLFT